MYKFIFEILTEPLGLPIEWYWGYLVLGIIGLIAYKLAFSNVGDLYDSGVISGRGIGSALHWIIRLFYFIVIWGITYLAIAIGKFIIANWHIILFACGSILGTAIICMLVIVLLRYISKKRTVSRNV